MRPKSDLGFDLTLINFRSLVPVHNLSYEVLNGTIEFVTFQLGCIQILGANGAVVEENGGLEVRKYQWI